MTYKESYQQLGSLEAIIEEAKKDINVASFINPDRVEVIVKMAEEGRFERMKIPHPQLYKYVIENMKMGDIFKKINEVCGSNIKY